MTEIKHHGSLSPEYALLGFLCEQPSHGYDLHQRLSSELGFVWHISQSQTYSILKRLESQGDISSKLVEQEKLPPRQVFKIKSKGRHRFMDWLDMSTNSSIRSIRLEFLTRLYFAQKIAPQIIQTLFLRENTEIRKTITRLENRELDIPADQIYNHLSLRLRIRQLHSALEWINECRKALIFDR